MPAAVAVSVPEDSRVPAILSVEFVAFVHVPVDAVMLPATVTAPLFVTVIVPMAIVPETERFAVEANDFAMEIRSPLEFVIEPEPSIVAPLVVPRVICPDPLNVPLTVRFPR